MLVVDLGTVIIIIIITMIIILFCFVLFCVFSLCFVRFFLHKSFFGFKPMIYVGPDPYQKGSKAKAKPCHGRP